MTRLLDRPLKPFEHTGDSANIAFYRERGTKSGTPGIIWLEVLRSVPLAKEQRSEPITFHFAIYRQGEGKIAETRVERARSNAPYLLPLRTIAQIVREALEAPAA